MRRQRPFEDFFKNRKMCIAFLCHKNLYRLPFAQRMKCHKLTEVVALTLQRAGAVSVSGWELGSFSVGLSHWFLIRNTSASRKIQLCCGFDLRISILNPTSELPNMLPPRSYHLWKGFGAMMPPFSTP